MSTVDDAARAVLESADTDAHFQKALNWCSDRFRELTNRSRFRSLREIGELKVPAALQTGTITATRGSNIITGNAAAAATWTDDLAGRHIRVRGRHNWYEIGGVVGGATPALRLTSSFEEDDASAVAYDIVQRWVKLDKRVRHLGKFVWMRLGRELSNETLTDLDVNFPDRLTTTSGGPMFVAEVGRADTGERIVEVYPYSTTSEIYHYVFWPKSPDFKAGDLLPDCVDPYVLREGALIDLYRFEAARALRAGKVEEAATFGNWAARQRQLWEQAIREANKADKGLDDVTLILRSGTFGFDGRHNSLINHNARTEIWIRGNRP